MDSSVKTVLYNFVYFRVCLVLKGKNGELCSWVKLEQRKVPLENTLLKQMR